jgi:2-C-methyl-D-erythritol 2,4-cyclodiphosphate synthase
MDAMLGAAAMADIGTHFPPGDPQYKNVSSLVLLGKVRALLAKAGWQVNNVDATVVAERPRLREYIDRMRQKLSEALEISTGQVSVKAGTSERLGFVGREEGIAAYAIVSVEAK